jgi:hypothetical protein
MKDCLGVKNEQIQSDLTYGTSMLSDGCTEEGPINQLWLSNRKASEGIQWSLVLEGEKVRFGLNIENKPIQKKIFGAMTPDEVASMLRRIKDSGVPGMSLGFHRRHEDGKKFIKGCKHQAYEWYDENRSSSTITDGEIEKMVEVIVAEETIEFSVWINIGTTTEIGVLTPRHLSDKLGQLTKGLLGSLWNDLDSKSHK